MVRTPVEERRRGLVSAALRVVASHGLSAASTRAIVAEAGMSLASFHYAFASRDELIDLLITETLANEEKAVVPASLEGKSLVELLTEGLMGYLHHLQSDPPHEQAMLELTQYALRARVPLAQRQYEQYTRIAVTSLELAARHTGNRWTVPIHTAAKLLVSLTDGLTVSWLVDRDDALAERVIVAAARALSSLAAPVSGEVSKDDRP